MRSRIILIAVTITVTLGTLTGCTSSPISAEEAQARAERLQGWVDRR